MQFFEAVNHAKSGAVIREISTGRLMKMDEGGFLVDVCSGVCPEDGLDLFDWEVVE